MFLWGKLPGVFDSNPPVFFLGILQESQENYLDWIPENNPKKELETPDLSPLEILYSLNKCWMKESIQQSVETLRWNFTSNCSLESIAEIIHRQKSWINLQQELVEESSEENLLNTKNTWRNKKSNKSITQDFFYSSLWIFEPHVFQAFIDQRAVWFFFF